LSLSIAAIFDDTQVRPPAIMGSPRLKLTPLSLLESRERQAAGIEFVLASAGGAEAGLRPPVKRRRTPLSFFIYQMKKFFNSMILMVILHSLL
jgi:hypothetical protein